MGFSWFYFTHTHTKHYILYKLFMLKFKLKEEEGIIQTYKFYNYNLTVSTINWALNYDYNHTTMLILKISYYNIVISY